MHLQKFLNVLSLSLSFLQSSLLVVFYFLAISLLVNYLKYKQSLSFQLKRVIESDAAMTEDLVAYDIIPLDAPARTNAIGFFPEVVLISMVTWSFCPCWYCYYLLILLSTGPSCIFCNKVLQGSTKVASRFFYTPHKECRHVWFSALHIWISGWFVYNNFHSVTCFLVVHWSVPVSKFVNTRYDLGVESLLNSDLIESNMLHAIMTSSICCDMSSFFWMVIRKVFFWFFCFGSWNMDCLVQWQTRGTMSSNPLVISSSSC